MKLTPFRIEDLLDSPEAVAEYERQRLDEKTNEGEPSLTVVKS